LMSDGILARHVGSAYVAILTACRMRDVIALCWYVPWLQEGGQVRLVKYIKVLKLLLMNKNSKII
jgi:hypothetical protein